MQKTTSDRAGIALMALHQGTMHGHPLCGPSSISCASATSGNAGLPDQWKQRIDAGTEPELWNRGMHGPTSRRVAWTAFKEMVWETLELCQVPHGHTHCGHKQGSHAQKIRLRLVRSSGLYTAVLGHSTTGHLPGVQGPVCSFRPSAEEVLGASLGL